MRKTQEEKISEASNLLDVLLILKEQIMRDLHVSTLGYIKKLYKPYDEVRGYSIYEVQPFPLTADQEVYTIYAYSLGDGFKENDIVVVLFTDQNFISSLDIERGKPKPTYDESLHSFKYGVIVKGGDNFFPPLPDDDKEHNLICKNGKIEWDNVNKDSDENSD